MKTKNKKEEGLF